MQGWMVKRKLLSAAVCLGRLTDTLQVLLTAELTECVSTNSYAALTLLTVLEIVVPLLRTVEEARQLVQSAKFPPLGQRGFGSPIAPERFNPVPSFTEYLQQANDALLTIVQIETKEALECVDEIAAVEGIDVLFIGPFDLGESAPIPRPHPWIDVLTGNRKQHWASHHQRGHCTRAESCLSQGLIC